MGGEVEVLPSLSRGNLQYYDDDDEEEEEEEVDLEDDEVLVVPSQKSKDDHDIPNQHKKKRSGVRRSKSGGGLTKLKQSIKRTLSMSSERALGGARRLNSRSGGDTDDNTQNSTGAESIIEIGVDVGCKAAPLAQERLDEILSTSRFVRRQNRMLDMATFNKDAFEVGKLIARGGFANVHRLETWHCASDLNEDENYNNQYAVKSLKIQAARNTPERLAHVAADLMMEAYFLSTFNHPHILKLRGICDRGLMSLAYGRVDGLFLILDYLPMTLYKKMHVWKDQVDKALNKKDDSQQHRVLEMVLTERLQAAVDFSSALEYLHQRNIIYRDIKPSNAGFNVHGCLQLFDFGLAIEVPASSDPNKLYHLAGKKGTARYMAPEVIKKGKLYNAKADVFSFCILLWQMMALEKPYGGQTTSDQAMRKILNGDRPSLASLAQEPSTALLDAPSHAALTKLLQQGWSKHIDERPFMGDVHNLLAKILNENKPKDQPASSSSSSVVGGSDEMGISKNNYSDDLDCHAASDNELRLDSTSSSDEELDHNRTAVETNKIDTADFLQYF